MTPSKILIFLALGIVLFKFIASLLGKGNIPFLNRIVTIILGFFITFELLQLGRALLTHT